MTTGKVPGKVPEAVPGVAPSREGGPARQPGELATKTEKAAISATGRGAKAKLSAMRNFFKLSGPHQAKLKSARVAVRSFFAGLPGIKQIIQRVKSKKSQAQTSQKTIVGEGREVSPGVATPKKPESEAQRLYGEALKFIGTENPADEKIATGYLVKAALKGSVNAMSALGFRFEHGIGCEKSATMAERWYTAAAKKRDARAIEWFQKRLDAKHLPSTPIPTEVGRLIASLESKKEGVICTPEMKQKIMDPALKIAWNTLEFQEQPDGTLRINTQSVIQTLKEMHKNHQTEGMKALFEIINDVHIAEKKAQAEKNAADAKKDAADIDALIERELPPSPTPRKIPDNLDDLMKEFESISEKPADAPADKAPPPPPRPPATAKAPPPPPPRPPATRGEQAKKQPATAQFKPRRAAPPPPPPPRPTAQGGEQPK